MEIIHSRLFTPIPNPVGGGLWIDGKAMFTIVESITIMASTSERTRRVMICSRSILLELTWTEFAGLSAVVAIVQPILCIISCQRIPIVYTISYRADTTRF